MLKRLIIFVFPLFVLAGCNSYEKLLKSTDYGKKYEMALQYYEEKKYDKAYPLLEELAGLFRGTEKAEKIYYYYAWSNYHLGDYIMAGYHFKNFARTYPSSEFAEEALYMNAYCNYLNSPEYSLDQSATLAAISEFQLFIDRYPQSQKVKEANEMIDKLRFKLEKKAYEQTKLFYKTENFQSAIVSAKNTLREFPGTQHAEEISYIMLNSQYQFALNSIEEKKQERIRETLEFYKNFSSRYPQSEYSRDAELIFINASRLNETLSYIIASTYYKKGLYKDAYNSYRKALENYPVNEANENAAFMMVNSLYRHGDKYEGFEKLEAYRNVKEASAIAAPFIKNPAMEKSLAEVTQRAAERESYWAKELPFWFFRHRMYENAIKAAEEAGKNGMNSGELENMVLESWLEIADGDLAKREAALKEYRKFLAKVVKLEESDRSKLDQKYSRIFAAAPRVVKTFKGRKEFDEAINRSRTYLSDPGLEAYHTEIRLLMLESMTRQIRREKDPARAAKRWEIYQPEFNAEMERIPAKEQEKALKWREQIIKSLNLNNN